MSAVRARNLTFPIASINLERDQADHAHPLHDLAVVRDVVDPQHQEPARRAGAPRSAAAPHIRRGLRDGAGSACMRRVR